MKPFVIRAVARALAIVCAFALVGCAAERIRDDAQALAAQGDYEQAVAALEAGVRRYPDSVQLHSRLLLARGQAFDRLVGQAQTAASAGRWDEAQQLLERAQAFDDGAGGRARGLLADLQVARRQDAALAQASALAGAGRTDEALKSIAEALQDNRRHPGLLALQRRLSIDQRQAQVRALQQGLGETRPVSLDFRDANVRAVLDVLSRNSGVNFVIDKDVRDARVTVFAKSVRFEDALEMVLSAGQLARKVLDAKTVLIYPNTPEKQREHQEQIVKVFYLANGDPKGAAAFLKSMMKLREPYVDERDNLLAVHDSLENIQLAERLLALFDHPESEVLLDAEVLEVNADRLTELGVSPPTQVTLTALPPGGGSGLTLGSFPLRRADVGVSGLAASINARRTVDDVQTLANPRLRTRSHQKAKVLIGDKIPIVTTTTTPGVAGFVSESVSYQDVGIKLEVEPVVYPDDDVSISLNLEVSALGAQTKTASGTIAYQISTRDASTLLRLHDGETQLLAGLISSDERSNTAGLPGLADVPVLGRLFSDQTHSRTKTELVLAITPHIVRGQPHLDAAEAEAWVGTDVYQRLKPVGGRFDVAAETAPAAAAARPSASGLPAHSATESGAAAAPAVPAGTAPAIDWSVPVAVKAGDVFDLPVRLRTGVAVGTLAVRLRYPNQILGLVGFAPVPDLPEAAAQGAPAVHAEPDGVGVLEFQRAIPHAAAGALGLVRVQFKALKDGDVELGLSALPADPGVTVAVPAAVHFRVEP